MNHLDVGIRNRISVSEQYAKCIFYKRSLQVPFNDCVLNKWGSLVWSISYDENSEIGAIDNNLDYKRVYGIYLK